MAISPEHEAARHALLTAIAEQAREADTAERIRDVAQAYALVTGRLT